ncbi:MAG: hypothetical protein P9M13_01030 [Candidatus Ancaeobacter aquaticus]|nr:hypothetical protein [Candidatus Ancaeobacter aquaticus]
MDKFPLICTLAVMFVFFAGAVSIAGVQNLKELDGGIKDTLKKIRVENESSFSKRTLPTVTAGRTAQEELEKLLSPRKEEVVDSLMDTSKFDGINIESLRSIKVSLNETDERLSMKGKSIEVRGELLINF